MVQRVLQADLINGTGKLTAMKFVLKLPGKLLRVFFNLNIAICKWIESKLPADFRRSLLYKHELICAGFLNDGPNRAALDIGGGHLCPYAHRRDPALDSHVISLDILLDQVKQNELADSKIVGDACGLLPIAADSVDIVTSRSVLEHLYDNDSFIEESHRVLRPGGHSVHVFPCKWAPFAIINRILPNKLASWLVHAIYPNWQAVCGFRVFYRNCDHDNMARVFRSYGFEVEDVHLRYYQSIYFRFFVPFYMISVLYDLALWKLDFKQLACQIIIVARKPAP